MHPSSDLGRTSFAMSCCSVSSNCSQLQAHEYGLPDLPGASCCIHCQILDVFHLPCHSVSSSAQGQAHFRLASLNCPVHHGICIVRSLDTDFISHGHPMQLGVGHCFLPASILLQGCFGQWDVLLLLEWGAICVKLREI